MTHDEINTFTCGCILAYILYKMLREYTHRS